MSYKVTLQFDKKQLFTDILVPEFEVKEGNLIRTATIEDLIAVVNLALDCKGEGGGLYSEKWGNDKKVLYRKVKDKLN